MAGDWIKMECNTPDKPEVIALTVKMGWDDPDLTVGKLFKVWRWFDQHTTEGNAVGVTPALLDRYFGVTGFVTALTQVGWLTVTVDGISLPNFDRHNGASAKKRSLTAKRVANHKNNAKANAEANAKGNAEGNAPNVTQALPREEKRREEIDTSKVSPPEGVSIKVWADFVKYRRAIKAPITDTAIEGFKREALKAGITVEQALVITIESNWRGFKAEWLKANKPVSDVMRGVK